MIYRSLPLQIEKLKRNFRWHDWAIDKIPMLFSICFYLILINGRSSGKNLFDFFMFLVYSLSSTIYGYTVNNFADLKIDAAQGKENFLLEVSRSRRRIIVWSLALISLLSGFYFIDRPYFYILWISQFFIATFYSLPPLRFKEKGTLGLIVPFFAQLVLPTLICFAIFGQINSMACLLFMIYAVFKGGAYDIGHQFHDHRRDTQTDTKTFAVQHGHQSVLLLFRTFLILERITFILITYYLYKNCTITFTEYHLNPFAFILIVYIIIFLAVVLQEIKIKKISDPYYLDTRGLSNILHVILPNIIFPLVLAFLLLMLDLKYLVLVLFFIVWIFPTPSKLKWPIQTMFKWITK